MFCKVLILVVVLFVSAFCDELKLVLLHNNDMHSRFEETSKNSGTCKESNKNVSCYGGFARTAHVIRNFRQQANEGKIPPVLYLNAGDTYTGTSWYSVHKWKICADFMNILKPDAMALGNHEFDERPEGLEPFIKNVTFPVLAANLNFSLTPGLESVQKSIILDVHGTKVGIVGYLTPETLIISSPVGVKINDEIPVLLEETERLDKEGVKIIIAVGHSGYLMDQKIASEVPLVDIVIGGHTNTFLWNGEAPDDETPEDNYPTIVTQKSFKKVPVVQAYAYTKYLGVLNVTFDSDGDLIDFMGQPILLDHTIPQEEDVLQHLEIYRKKIIELDEQIVGKTKVILDVTTCRTQECNFGNLITDANVRYVASLTPSTSFWTNAPIGLLNGGSIRNSLDPATRNGNITRGDIVGILPFDNRIGTIILTGKELLETLEIGARSNGETSLGEFLQVSGIKYVVDFRKPPMSRITSVQTRCGNCLIPRYTNIDLDQNYTVIITSFMGDGGDGYYLLQNKEKKYEDINDVDMLQWYLENFSPVYAEVQGRITIISKDTASSTTRFFISRFSIVGIIIHIIYVALMFCT